MHTIGCRLNDAERRAWTREFEQAGVQVVPELADADVAIFNTCAVTRAAAKESRRFTRAMHRENPRARLVLTGCYASLEPEVVAGLAGVDLVVDNRDKDLLVPKVVEALALPTMPAAAVDSSPFASAHTRAFVKVQDGCRNRCTFCIVTVARGEERSRTIDDIVDELERLYADGYREAVLTGVHLGGYGSDLGTDLRSLLEQVLTRTHMPRIRMGSLEPWDLPEGFFELWSDPRMCDHLHLPMQSGSNRILKRMARRCSAESFAALTNAARQHIPDLSLTTDLIVGFPGETEVDFAETMAFTEQLGFADAHLFTWSPREGTAANRFPNRVPRAEQRERSAALHELVARQRAAHIAGFAGETRPVLFEGKPRQVDAGIRWTGYTDNYVPVAVVTVDPLPLRGKIMPVTLGAPIDDRRVSGVLSRSSSPCQGTA